jgi:hypothetical protein
MPATASTGYQSIKLNQRRIKTVNKESNKNRIRASKDAVTKHDVTNAHQAKRTVGAAVDALQKIELQSIGYDQSTYSKITDFTNWLNEFVEKFESIIKLGEHQYENRPVAIIHAATQRMFEIPGHIEAEEKNIKSHMQCYETKAEELRKKGFTTEQIASIIPYPQNEIGVSKKALADMKTEAKDIEMFLGDSPRYDLNLIKNAKLDSFLQLHKMNRQA